jgi:hypothetical protein
MTRIIVAQALAEKGALDGLVTGMSYAFSRVGDTLMDYPWALIAIAVVLFLLLKKRR